MILNTCEFLAMNNPLRAAMQRHLEARWFLREGGAMNGGRALEIGCGRGVGAGIIADRFQAAAVDAFDLDPRMIARAERRLAGRRNVKLWTGDATLIQADDATYDAVFDFGIIHHIPEWRAALAEVCRVLKPGGRFYAEEVLKAFILSPIWRRLLDHPLEDRFDHREFLDGLARAGFTVVAEKPLWNCFGWYIADKKA